MHRPTSMKKNQDRNRVKQDPPLTFLALEALPLFFFSFLRGSANIRQFRAFTDVQLCQIGYHLRFCGLAAVALVIKEKYVVCNHIKVLEIKMRK